MRAGDGPPGDAADQVTRRQFMGRVAGAEAGRHGIAGDAIAKAQHRRLQCVKVQRGDFVAGVVVAAGHGNDRIALQRLGQAGSVKLGLFKADEDQRHAAALAFDQRIGGQRGRQGHQRDFGRADARLGHRRIDSASDPRRQIGPRRQRLGRGDHPACVFIQHHRIGVGAARIDPQKVCHLSASILFAPIQPIRIAGALVFPPISVGKAEASQTRRPMVP